MMAISWLPTLGSTATRPCRARLANTQPIISTPHSTARHRKTPYESSVRHRTSTLRTPHDARTKHRTENLPNSVRDIPCDSSAGRHRTAVFPFQGGFVSFFQCVCIYYFKEITAENRLQITVKEPQEKGARTPQSRCKQPGLLHCVDIFLILVGCSGAVAYVSS
jgi:hypothetical protein